MVAVAGDPQDALVVERRPVVFIGNIAYVITHATLPRQQLQLSFTVDLIKAVGGGWTPAS